MFAKKELSSSNLGISKILKFSQESEENVALLKNVIAKKDVFVSIGEYTTEDIEKACAVMVTQGLSKSQYKAIRDHSIKAGIKNLFPPYKAVSQLRATFLPLTASISDNIARVPLFSAVEETITDIVKASNPQYSTDDNEIKFVFKTGIDGATSNAEYRLPFKDDSSSDQYFYIVTFCPVSLELNGKILFHLEDLGSTLFTRPLCVCFKKETPEIVQTEFANLVDSFSDEFTMEMSQGTTVKISCQMKQTMLDGAAVNAIVGNKSTLKCYICDKSFKDFKGMIIQFYI